MTAQELTSMLRFDAQFPSIYLRDFSGDRIRVLTRNGDHLATISGVLDWIDGAVVLLFKDDAQSEFRGSYGTIADLLSVYQQSGGDMDAVHRMEEMLSEWDI